MNTLVILAGFYSNFYTMVYFSFLARRPWPVVNGALWYKSPSAWIPPTDSLLKKKNNNNNKNNFSPPKTKKAKQRNKQKKKHLNIAPYFRQLPLLFELQNTEFSFQFNSFMILYINENLVNLRNNEFSLYRKSEWISSNVKIKQLAKGLVYLTTITDLFIWFQVTYPSPVKS